jgi:curli biogenesis system outer membrane secretion channel CsgG
MKRSMKYLVALVPAIALMSSAAVAQSNTPVVAVLAFENSAFGPGAKDYDGIGKGIMDLMITDLASGTKVRVVDRERLQNLLDEQKLAQSGAVDGATAIKVGKLVGACYSIYGSFIRDQKTGDNVITVHTTSNETGQIQNAQKITSKGDDMMKLIADASAAFIKSMDVKACGSASSRSASAAPAQQSGVPVTKDAGKPAVAVETFAKPLSEQEKKQIENVKIDARTMLLYSRALDAIDHKDKAKAVELLRQVVQKAPAPFPASEKLNALTKSGT